MRTIVKLAFTDRDIFFNLNLIKEFFICFQYTMQDLLDRIQASEEELMSHLETIHACQIDGKYFLFLHNNSMLMNWTFFTKI